MTPTDLITTRETAQRLHVSVGTLKRWRRCHSGPPWCRVGSRAVRYPVALLDVWLDDLNGRTGFDIEDGADGKHRELQSTGIILTASADQGSQPRRWNFLANIRPQGG